jgi:hypothetical protein
MAERFISEEVRMARDPQPHLDGKRRVHTVAGLILLLVVIAFLVIFIATNLQRAPDGGGGFIGSVISPAPPSEVCA